jgi:hypothetical protein
MARNLSRSIHLRVEDQIARATARIELCVGGEVRRQTGFLFDTEQGLLLTVAHGFFVDGNPDEPAVSEATVTIGASGVIAKRATLVEWVHDKAAYVDYAILRLCDPSAVASIRPLRLSTNFCNWVNGPCWLRGFKGSEPRLMAIPDVKSYTPLYASPTNIVLGMSITWQKLEGMSGCPLVVYNRKQGRPVVVGLQTQQFSDRAQAIAIPIRSIYGRSDRLKQYFLRLRIQSVSFLQLDADLFVRAYGGDHNKRRRFYLLLEPHLGEAGLPHDTFREVCIRWESAMESVHQLLASNSCFRDYVYKIPAKKLTTPSRNPPQTLDEYFADAYATAGDYRGIVTFDDGLLTAKRTAPHSNHLVGIRVGNHSFDVRSDPELDLSVHLPQYAADDTAITVLRTLGDVHIDCLAAMAIPILRHNFRSNASEREVVQSKVAFACKQNLRAYDKQLPEKAAYISFSACVKKSPVDQLNNIHYYRLWEAFVTEFLFPSLFQRERVISFQTPLATAEEVITELKKKKSVAGQLQYDRIRVSLRACEQVDQRLYVIAIIRAGASQLARRDRLAMRSLFRLKAGQKLRPNDFVIRPADEIGEILKFRRFLKCFVFRLGSKK